MRYLHLKKISPQLFKILLAEQKRQKQVINLIPSENYVSVAVLEALATVFTNKYAEGYSHARYYFGNRYVDEMEDYAKSLVYKAFRISPAKWGVNVQAYSGSTANLAAYLAVLKPGERILSMSLEHGGHLTHGHKVSFVSTLYDVHHYGVGEDGYINYSEVERIAKKVRPKLIICGASAYSRFIDFKKFRAIASQINALLLADIAHIAGLIVAGTHPSAFPHADIVTTTTHKTLRGPRAAIIISKKEVIRDAKPFALSASIDKAVFPGLQGGPHINTIFALAVSMEEALKPSFKQYVKQIVKNAKALSRVLLTQGVHLISGGTDNHLVLVDITPFGHTGKSAGEALERIGIVVNKNMIPYDTRKPWDPSGIRLGTPAITTQGAKEKHAQEIGEIIAAALKKSQSQAKLKQRVKDLLTKMN